MHIWPLSETGAAAEFRPLTGAREGFALTDLTAMPRFGLKGEGAPEWFTAQGFALPQVNVAQEQKGMRLLRLGSRDIMVLADVDAPHGAAALVAGWQAKPQGYSSWREESWAWLRLTGVQAPAVLSRLTAFDIRDGAFSVNYIAQTRVAHMDMVLLRVQGGFDLLFDIASTAQVLRDVDTAYHAVVMS